MSAFGDMPSLFIPKKRCHEEIPHLTDRKDRLSSESDKARKKLKAHGSCNAQFWSAAAEVEAIVLSKTRVVSEISLAEFEGEPSAWECTEEAKMLFEQMRAQQVRMTSYQKQALTLTRKRGSLRESFMNLFTSSRMGLGIATGMGPRDSSVQSNFRRNLLADYESVGENGLVWCPIIQDWFHSDFMTASHLFSYRHGQATMDVIFGKVRPAELFSSRNGLIMCSIIERYFDAGVMVIVPNVPERPTNSMLSNWIRQEIREYKFRIIDSSWDQLDRVLRRAWKVGPGQRAAFYLTDELGKPFWGTPGRYIAKNMLRALVEELGHEFEHLMGGATLMSRGDDDLLLSTAAAQVVQVDGSDDDDTDDDDMDEQDYY
ncbi:hypothetical protein APSETT444_009859 [Aspergillus pseudonomiae]